MTLKQSTLQIFLWTLITITSFSCTTQTPQSSEPELSAWDKTVKGLEKFGGYVPYYWDNKTGKIYLEIDKWDTELLYVNYLSAGVGSNDIGLDRGQIGGTRIISFKRIGNKVLMFQPNYDYRATTENPLETKAIEDAFARSITWGFTIVAEQDWSVLVDATDFFLRDAHNVSGSLARSGQGTYRLDKNRSALNLEGSRNFPENTEVDVWLTFNGNPSGGYIRQVTPDASAVTVRQHHSFVQLPDNQFEPRKLDVRAGYFTTSYKDYGVPIAEDINQRYINRHRLQKKDPEAAMSEPVEPIIYYLDPGTPEPVRSALLDGARWWNQAFEAAGYKDAFLVKMLPEDADPLDIRYNVIQWVHRATRGWSYGASVVDPRTGEIIKGHVTLGSLRVRQDFLIATGLLAPYKGDNVTNEMQEMALARLRQLSAHEVGHTLGLAHNFAASISERASVMDYPHPQIDVNEKGQITLENAYDTNIGEWDKIAITYGYQDYPENTDAAQEANQLLEKAYADGLRFISDYDARPSSGSHPFAHLWDNGKDPVVELNRLLNVRQKAIANFGEDVIPSGAPIAKIHDVLVPIYFLHRYQVEAAAKVVGGVEYNYKLKGDNQDAMQIVQPAWQKEAVFALLSSVSPESLALPESLLNQLYPRPIGYYGGRELIDGHTGPNFDALGAAEQAATHSLSFLLNASRANRLVEFHSRDEKFPGLTEVLDISTEYLVESKRQEGYSGAIQQRVQSVYVNELMRLYKSGAGSSQVKAVVLAELESLHDWYNRNKRYANSNWKAHYAYLAHEISQFIEEPKEYSIPAEATMPPGSPIGTDVFCGTH